MTLIPRLPFLYQPQNWLAGHRNVERRGDCQLVLPMFTQTLGTIGAMKRAYKVFVNWADRACRRRVNYFSASGNEIVLYLFGLISAAGVMVLLACTMSMSFMLMTRSENKAKSWRDVIVPFSTGLTIAFSVILLIDVVRFTFTGTWGGFVIPGAF